LIGKRILDGRRIFLWLKVFLDEFFNIKTKFFYGSVVAVIFQSVFYLEIYQNNIFFIFKKLFMTSVHQNDLKH
jgi:hypothetical protein